MHKKCWMQYFCNLWNIFARNKSLRKLPITNKYLRCGRKSTITNLFPHSLTHLAIWGDSPMLHELMLWCMQGREREEEKMECVAPLADQNTLKMRLHIYNCKYFKNIDYRVDQPSFSGFWITISKIIDYQVDRPWNHFYLSANYIIS